MLNLIAQDRELKVAIDTYNVADSKDENRIYGFLNGTLQGELARYKQLEDAVRVFWGMVEAESRDLFVQLPKDDPREIASFFALVKTTSGQCFDDKFD